MFCPNCGTENGDNERCCTSCRFEFSNRTTKNTITEELPKKPKKNLRLALVGAIIALIVIAIVILSNPGKSTQQKMEESNLILEQAIGYYTGITGEVNYDKAKPLFLKAAEVDNPLAKLWLARCYISGRASFEIDSGKAQNIAKPYIGKITDMAEEGNANAQFLLGSSFVDGLGLDISKDRAFYWYNLSADQGYSIAQYYLGIQLLTGRGTEKDPDRGMQLIHTAAEQGLASAVKYVAVNFLWEGKGVELDTDQGLKWLRKAVSLGDPNACVILGSLYKRGKKGVVKNNEEAVKWFRKAAMSGDKYGQYHLGVMYKNGYGVEQNDKKAVKWFRKAADKGNKKAQEHLDLMINDGREKEE